MPPERTSYVDLHPCQGYRRISCNGWDWVLLSMGSLKFRELEPDGANGERYVAVAPKYGLPDTTTIQMDSWVLTFPRAKKIYDQLMKERIWMNAAAQGEITKLLRRKGLLMPASRAFGNLAQPVQLQDDDYINYRVVSFGLSDLDDMSA